MKNENGNASDPVIIPAPLSHTNTRINFWILNGTNDQPTDGKDHEVIIQKFKFEAL